MRDDGDKSDVAEGSPVLRSLGLVSGLIAVAALICVLYVVFADERSHEERLADSRLHLRRGDLPRARQELLSLHQDDPNNPEVLEALAQLEMQGGDLPKAIEWLEQVPSSLSQRAAAARFEAAQLAMQLGRAGDAEAMAREALQLDPRFAEPRRLLLRCYFVLRQHRQLVEQSVRLDEQEALSRMDLLMRCVAHRASWDDDEHVAWLQACLRQDPTSAAIRAALAHNHAVRDNNHQAWNVLKQASPEAPDFWRILLSQAELEIREGRFEQAWKTIAQFPAAADAESRAWLARGKVWTELGHDTAALAAFENAAKLDPYDPAPPYAISRIMAAQGESEKGKLFFDHSQRLNELMGLLSRLVEASNPAYHPAEPVETTLNDAERALRDLGFDREAEILAAAGTASTGRPSSKPLTITAIADLAEPVDAPAPQISGASAGPVRDPGEPQGEIRFADIAAEINLTFEYDTGRSPFRWLMETLGGGVAAFDYDLDGWEDLYLSQAGPLPIDPAGNTAADRLFRNVLGRTAQDVTLGARLSDNAYGQGCAVGDYDNDGFADLVVCNYGALLVYKNQGDGTFIDAGAGSGIASSAWSSSAAFCDIERDGDLDLYVVNYLDAEFKDLRPCKFEGAYTSCRPFGYAGAPDVLWENQGDGRFADRTEEFGLIAPNGKGLGVATVDFEGQGRDAVFVGNDTTANFLFSPDPDSPQERFRETASLSGVAVNRDGATEACMGVAAGDIDGDGRFDLLVTNFVGETNTLYRCLGDGLFTDDTQRAGIADSSRNRMGWGCQFVDIDCNGDLDLFVANGMLHEVPQLAQLYHNSGDGRFREISHVAGDYFRTPRLGRSVACLDWNRDLAIDLAVTYQEGNVSLLENQCATGNRLMLQLTGVESNRDAAGSRVRARIGDRVLHFHVTRNGGYFAANSPHVLIGCGNAPKIDLLEVIWPSGKTASWADVPVGSACFTRENDVRLVTRDE